MLRGSRHDGIPNNQSARERDRQRERQKQERAQMLPNVDKDVTANSQDLFHPPRQVKPSVDDPTSLEIKKSLGNFESVRPYMLENSSRRLIGVDQYTAGSASSGSNSSTPDKQQRLSLPPSGTGNSSTNNNKSSSVLPHRNFVQGPSSASVPSLPSNTSTANLFRPSNPVPKVPLIPNQLQPPALLPPPTTHHYNQVVNSSHPHRPTNSSSSGSSSVPPTHSNPHRLNNSTPNYSHTHTNNTGASNSEVVPPPVSEVVRSKVDRLANSSSAVLTDKSLRTSAPSAGVPNDKNLGSVSNNKPALQRADSQLELENMLREMMDVKPPLSAIPTPSPLKESPPKRFSQRRSSKEENSVQNPANNTVAVANIVSSPKSSKMDSSGDSSSNGDSSSESDSEDSSSTSQTGADNTESMPSKNIPNTVNSPPRNWDLSTLMNVNVKKDNINIKTIPDSSALSKSPKDGKLRKNLQNSNSDELPIDPPIKIEPSVTSTSVFGKPLSSSPLEPTTIGLSHVSKVPGKSPRRTPDMRPDPHIPAKAPPPSVSTVKSVTASALQASSQGPSLSGSSSEDEADIPKKDPPPRVPVPEPKPPPVVVAPPTRGAKRRKKSSSSSDRNINKSEDDSSPETKSKSKKVVQDRNKNDMIGKLFRGRKKKKLESPSVVEKANTTSGTTSSGSKSKLTSSNRVSAKDSGRKSASTTNVITVTPPTSLVQNGELGASSNITTASGAKKRDSSISGSGKDSSTSATLPHHGGKRRQKSNTTAKTVPAKSTSVTTLPPPPASSVVRVKEEPTGKLSPASLICRIPLSKILRPPNSTPLTPANLKAPPPTKADKGGSASSGSVGHLGSREESTRSLRLHYDSSRVGSSSDQANDTHEKVPHTGPLGEEPVCSVADRRAANNHSTYKRERRKSRSSQKKSKAKPEPVSHSKISKIEEDTTVACEVSSNVIGYTVSTHYPPLVSTTRTPPVEVDVAQAPDSSLNPPHLPSPVVQPQMQFYSYFDKIEHNDSDDYFSRGQEAYLVEAKRLKHKADREESGLQIQASTYLEAGLYFILAGYTIEKERSMWSREAFTMYKDTLTLIRFIGSQFRTRQDNSNEAKITVLSLRCQALLAMKLFRMKMKETKEGAQYLNDHFQKTPPLDIPPMANSPHAARSTPSPLSPTLSPAGSSGHLMGHTPSPHHPQQQNHQTTNVSVSRTLYSQMFKHCSNTMHVISAHELWEAGDILIEKHHIQDFFISIDRIYGPLTLHTQLIDLVRYVRHGLGVLKNCSDSS